MRHYTVFRVHEGRDTGRAVAPPGRYEELGTVRARNAAAALRTGRRKFKVGKREPLAVDLGPDDGTDVTPTPAESHRDPSPGRIA